MRPLTAAGRTEESCMYPPTSIGCSAIGMVQPQAHGRSTASVQRRCTPGAEPEERPGAGLGVVGWNHRTDVVWGVDAVPRIAREARRATRSGGSIILQNGRALPILTLPAHVLREDARATRRDGGTRGPGTGERCGARTSSWPAGQPATSVRRLKTCGHGIPMGANPAILTLRLPPGGAA